MGGDGRQISEASLVCLADSRPMRHTVSKKQGGWCPRNNTWAWLLSYICTCIHVPHTYMYLHTHVHLHTWICIHTYVHTHDKSVWIWFCSKLLKCNSGGWENEAIGKEKKELFIAVNLKQICVTSIEKEVTSNNGIWGICLFLWMSNYKWHVLFSSFIACLT